ncbi:ATP-dependent RNA helicase SUPV3L1/SUV3 [Filomicrobium insigne]|uniref:ATP-dependent RNA helicase SUPV3L1/SUV3 n=1 Tax=Filomicrobium insigne TaxID=418854 RepID=A0A1H0TNR0_9HYPH|nr:helicase-related protein [Filomicrobium insigne]SDP55196.1 ATP-dependent RNA helicase SUPV3L1/SUV3 [Filomicrobium insigne]
MGSNLETRIRHVTAVLGPTNTGKTHLAIERMLGHASGMIGLPLRLLAREVYDKIGHRIGFQNVALITGEEKIKPERARYWVSTVEAMPRDIDVDFLAIDEIQLAADPERGHVFTDRLLHARGRQETLLLGAQTMRDCIQDLIDGANFISRPRLSKLTYAGEKKITRLPTRSAVVAFSASEVYSIAELIRRQRGGAAVVLGALSPRTRNAQVELYQSGDVDFLVATDAIGMGLNLDVDHVAFASVRKFDGQNHRNLTPSELAQIAGRAGRHMNDGTFGVTAGVEPFDADVIERLESHTFDPVKVLQWRTRNLDYGSVDRLRDSLREVPGERRLTRARMADDVEALEAVANDREVVALAQAPAAVAKLWDVCQVPDYRKISSSSHAELVGVIYKHLMGPGEKIPEDWFAKQVQFADRTDGDIDTLANRIAHIRTWTFVSNRSDWLKDPAHWQGRTREIEDKLSDALHECLTQRFVDRRTSALMKGMRDKDELNAEIAEDGTIKVEDHYVGRLVGFRFSPETQVDGIHAKATRHAAAQVLARELGMRARRVAAAKPDAFTLSPDGRILWRDQEVAVIEAAEDQLRPTVNLLVDEHLSAPDKEKIQARLDTWISEHVREKLKPLVEMAEAEDITGLARGIAFQLKENFGILKRELVADEVKALDQTSRAQLRRHGVRFGAFNIYMPLLLKPAAAELAATLWVLKSGDAHGITRSNLPVAPRAGLTSIPTDAATPEPFYRAYGFHVCGPRAVRLDILERLADQIRPLLAWRNKAEEAVPDRTPPKGATGDGGFTVTPEMMSILGCSPDELGNVLKALGFRSERREVKRASVAAEIESDSASPTVQTSPEADAAEATHVADASLESVATPASEIDASPDSAETSAELVASTTENAAEVAAEAVQTEPSQEDTPSESATEAPVSEASGEPEFIEIWRPKRHHRSHDGGHRDRRRGRGRHRSGGEGAHDATSSTGGAANGAGAQHAGANSDKPKSGEHGDRRGSSDGKKSHGREGQARGDGRGRGPKRGKWEGGRGREDRRRPEVHSSSPRGKGGSVDPDSPFAALVALKEALQKQGDEPNT